MNADENLKRKLTWNGLIVPLEISAIQLI